MRGYGFFAAVGVTVLALAAPARAKPLTLACEYKSGAFEGSVISVVIDFDTRMVLWGDSTDPERAEITERYITLAPTLGRIGRRLDRITGIVSFWTRQTPYWNDRMFGVPGLVCRSQPRQIE